MAIISFAVRIEHHHTAVRLHDVRLHIESGFARTTSSYVQNIQVSPVLMRIEPDPHILRQYLIHV
jgi:hypothetical protein